jgi:hypothetical protein
MTTISGEEHMQYEERGEEGKVKKKGGTQPKE